MIIDNPSWIEHRLFTREEWKLRYHRWRVLKRELAEAERKMIAVLNQLSAEQRRDAIDRIVNPPVLVYWGKLCE